MALVISASAPAEHREGPGVRVHQRDVLGGQAVALRRVGEVPDLPGVADELAKGGRALRPGEGDQAETDCVVHRGKMNSSFSKWYSDASDRLSTTSWRKNFVVSSVAIPDGHDEARLARWRRHSDRLSSAKTLYVFTSPRPQSGYRAAVPDQRDFAFRLARASCQARHSGRVIGLRKAGNQPLSGRRSSWRRDIRARAAKNSFSWSFIRSQGGFPSTTSNPPGPARYCIRLRPTSAR